MDLHSDIEELKGIGKKTAQILRGKEIFTAGDLLTYYPARYEFYPVPAQSPGSLRGYPGDSGGERLAMLLTVIGNGLTAKVKGRTITHIRAGDPSGEIRLTFFNMPYIRSSLPAGTVRVFYGRMKFTNTGLRYMEQPAVFTPDAYEVIAGTMQPVYPLTSGITNRQITSWIRQILESSAFGEGGSFKDPLTKAVRDRYGLCGLQEAMRGIHFPGSPEELQRARNRIVFDEFFRFILGVRRQKEDSAAVFVKRPLKRSPLPGKLIDSLPYTLTGAQKRAWEQIEKELCGSHVMNRLLQGDVGSGKTIIAFLALLMCSGSGRQGALMAPTEVLARQHMASLSSLCEKNGLPLKPVLLTGSVKGAERKEIYRKIRDGEADVIIGTHALIQESLEYHDLALVITDEQHRFGVRQREYLAGKGQDIHVLVMSATPIPRTLAIILYGDLEISVLDEMPPGRLPVKNAAMSVSERGRVYRFLYKQLMEGRQAYVICPEVEEGVMEDLENVTEYSAKLRKIFPENIRIGMLHGRMKPAQKQAVMDAFARHETDILVSTTVIEVGIDVPNASVILIENAERFGMSSLHQLRGRVGRGKWQSYCVFLYNSQGGVKPERLDVLEHTNDGFKIAEEDLRLRGPGDLFGVRQSGVPQFRLADIYTDADILRKAAACAEEFAAEGLEGGPEDLRKVDFRSI